MSFMPKPLRCIILGAAGRDFHDFQMFFRERADFQVVAFTAAQIPFIENRSFPKELAGSLYNADIPTFPEHELPSLITRFEVDLVFLAYSDLPHAEVMHKASLVQSCGAGFAMLGPHLTQLRSNRAVVAVTAVRTGSGKSPLTQAIARHLHAQGRRVSVLRHPMPYGDLREQRTLRYTSEADLARHHCTIEEREEYEPYVAAGIAVFAGVDYRSILAEAEKECDVVLWDGGNNDYPFVRPDLSIVVLDALRPGHEIGYYPGETNLRAANVLVLNKVSSASTEALAPIRRNVAELNPNATLIEADLAVTLEPGVAIAGKRVVVVEDGPTLTHGGMAYGAGTVAARTAGALILDPRDFAIGSIAAAYRDYPHIGAVVPALGYSQSQQAELEETLRRGNAEVIVDASPARLDRILRLDAPIARVSYSFEQKSGPSLFALVDDFVSRAFRGLPENPSR
jgi:predicted GTPase